MDSTNPNPVLNPHSFCILLQERRDEPSPDTSPTVPFRQHSTHTLRVRDIPWGPPEDAGREGSDRVGWVLKVPVDEGSRVLGVEVGNIQFEGLGSDRKLLRKWTSHGTESRFWGLRLGDPDKNTDGELYTPRSRFNCLAKHGVKGRYSTAIISCREIPNLLHWMYFMNVHNRR